MTNRENFISLIKKTGYEWIPVEFGLCPSLIDKVESQFGSRIYEEVFKFPWRFVDDIQLIEHDVEKYRPFFRKPFAEGADIDIWGVGHEKSPNSMHMTYMRNPLKEVETLEEIQAYPFPDFANGRKNHQKGQVEAFKNADLIAVGYMPMTIWEISWYLRGIEELFCDMMLDDEKAYFLFDKILEIQKIRVKAFVEAGVDVLFIGDDIGMQHSIMMSEDLYCEWIKPRLKELIRFAKEINPEVIVFYHSCGFIEPFITHLIECGVDVLNPIQSECMDFEEIYNKYGDKISFHGTIGTQTTMPHGTPDEVIKTVHRNLNIAGKNGGLMVAPTHMLEPEVPMENIFAYIEACRTYKK